MDNLDDDIILKCIKDVYEELGNFNKENVYQSALYIELNDKEFTVQTEVMIPITYKEYTVGFCRADIIIYKGGLPICILELKSQTGKLSVKEFSQLRKYLKYFRCPYGYVINFSSELEIKKVFNE